MKANKYSTNHKRIVKKKSSENDIDNYYKGILFHCPEIDKFVFI